MFLIQFTFLILSALAWSPAPKMYHIKLSDNHILTSLFPSDGPVLVAGTEFKVRDNDAVLYYSDGCPHCWIYSVKFMHVAEGLNSNGGSPKVRAVAVNCGDEEERKNICNLAGVSAYPSLKVYGGECPEKKQCSCGSLTDEADAYRCIAEYFGGSAVPDQSTVSIKSASKNDTAARADSPMNVYKPGWPDPERLQTSYDRQQDAMAGFLIALHDNYRPELFPQAVEAITFVVNSLPGSSYRNALEDCINRTIPNMTPGTFIGHLTRWENRHMILRSFTTCGTKTCGLWVLFHAVAAANAAKFKDEATAKRQMGRGASPEETLGFVNLMVTNFFSCTECQEHFKGMYESEARKQVQTGKDAAIWLWKAHNRVSLRVAREGNAVVDRRWPPTSMCFNCWSGNIINRRMSEHEVVGQPRIERARRLRRRRFPWTSNISDNRRTSSSHEDPRPRLGRRRRRLSWFWSWPSWLGGGGSSAPEEPEEKVQSNWWNKLETVYNVDNVFHFLLYAYVGEQYLAVKRVEYE